MGLLYEYMMKVGELLIKADRLTIALRTDVAKIWNVRWGWFYKPIHVVAHKLHLLWRTDMDPMAEVEEGWDAYASLIYLDPIVQNELEDDLLKFNRKEGFFAN